jgi:hypothetical protein
VASRYRTLGLDREALVDALARAPLEGTAAAAGTLVIDLPWPDGSFRRYWIEESPIMEPALAAQFPEFKTYRGQGIDELTASVRLDWTPLGLHAMLSGSFGSSAIVAVEPSAWTSDQCAAVTGSSSNARLRTSSA